MLSLLARSVNPESRIPAALGRGAWRPGIPPPSCSALRRPGNSESRIPSPESDSVQLAFDPASRLQTDVMVSYPLTSGQPLVAVVTPVHNGADSLAACLESVRAQSYRNWCHLVVDNASTDATRNIADSRAAQDPRVKVLSFRELLPMF